MSDVRKEDASREAIFEFDVANRDEKGGIPVVVTSDAVVMVEDGPEVLVHEPDAIDLRRAPLPIVVTHGTNQINVGIVEGLKPVKGQLRGMARFGERQEAREYRMDVENGTIRSVSARYIRMDGYVRSSDKVLVTTKWMPTHVAMIAEPADIRAGFYRSAPFIPRLEETTEQEPKERVLSTATPVASKGSQMADDVKPAAGASADVQVHERNPGAELGMSGEQFEKKRGEAIRKNAQAMGISDPRVIQRWISSGADWDAIGDEAIKILEERGRQATLAGGIGLTHKEESKYSMLRAIQAMVTRNFSDAGLEFEVSKEMAKRIGKVTTDQTFYMPLNFQQRTVMQVGTGSMGGYTVGTDITGFVDILRNRSVVIQSGARTLSGLQGVVAIPKKATAGGVQWIAEAGTGTTSEMTLSQLTMSPKALIAGQQYTKQLLLQGLPDVESLISMDLADGLAVELDRAALVGTSGSTNPVGVRFTTGIGTANPGTGSAVAYADLIKFQTTVAAANALLPGFTYITTPAVAGIYMGKSRFTNSDTPMWQGGLLDGQVIGMPGKSTAQMLSGVMLAGDYSQVLIGQWQGLQIDVNPYSNFMNDIVTVKATLYADVAVRYPSAFAVGTGMTG